MMLKHRLPGRRLATRLLVINGPYLLKYGHEESTPTGFGETGLFQGTREQMLIFEGNRETQAIDEHGKRDSLIWRNMGTRQLIS